MTEISFEYFDPEYELGNLDKNGKPIKPRKKPGRKPNPPTPAQRKAQNRAAQRAFRERKRHEMLNAEINVKRCLIMRDQALKKARRLRRKLDEVMYENNFLRGQVLTLKVACMANRVNVPKFWDTGKRDKMGSDITTCSRHKGIPQSMEFFLDRNGKIITMEENASACSTDNSDSTTQRTPFVSPENNHSQTTSDDDDDPNKMDMIFSLLPHTSPEIQTDSYTTKQSNYNYSDFEQVVTNILQNTNASLDPSLMHFIFEQQPDIITEMIQTMKDVPPELWLSMVPPEFSPFIPPEIHSLLNNFTTTKLNSFSKDKLNNLQTVNDISSLTSPPLSTHHLPEQELNISVDNDFWSEASTVDHEKIYVAGPIAPLDAVKQMRTMREQNDNRYLLTPTELQRRIPHDPRIDLIPGPTMRDYMIIFQDFYDTNELFRFLLESAVFIGGELGNPDCWFVPPSFIAKYWFLCPNYKPTRPDNSVELAVFFAERMLDSLKKRKAMYIMRDHYSDYFMPVQQDDVEVDDDDDENDDDNGMCSSDINNEENTNEEENENTSDIVSLLLEEKDDNMRIDILAINTINKEDIPRITSPNVFTI
ncbi:uncharacterized protein BX663DRAFT_504178 [Cokeromyces recurvatus]|uniref:uncharacterized protein n=1 Tax=Cokeromyces recurvatus TaxID=90255 RepID=UPI0022205C80|nr:uncharacterized protein BX663DRAFT_504178 [Cokeromyces recurvatus]KAI7904175.1 hypothetical protein BX663DRAFT_504178 [Cokeromyces recurvatus]